MSFSWLKRYMPRSLYGRAALILVLPVVLLQLVVSVVFIQRHFEGVTRQMTRAVSREVNLVLDALEGAEAGPRAGLLAEALAFDIARPDAIPDDDERRFYDLTGIAVISTLARFAPRVERVVLHGEDRVELYARLGDGPVRLGFDRRRVSASNPHQLLVYIFVLGGLLTAVAFIYLRNQLRPITRLAHAAGAFGRGRHVPYTPSGAVEVRAAGHAFLDMRARIERQIEQRTAMLSGVSHDLRTPLTRLSLGLSMLDETEREPLERDVEDMRRLLDEFLDFARGDADAGAPEPVDPVALLRQLAEDARRAGRDVALVEADCEGEVPLRAVAIRRALENLVANAVRYGSRAELSVKLGSRSLRLRVEDDGPGIPRERRADALRPFVRLDAARNQDSGAGVGLGLAIAGDIARAHGGVLRLGCSERLGGLRADIVIAR